MGEKNEQDGQATTRDKVREWQGRSYDAVWTQHVHQLQIITVNTETVNNTEQVDYCWKDMLKLGEQLEIEKGEQNIDYRLPIHLFVSNAEIFENV